MSVGKIRKYALPYSNVVASGVATNMIAVGRTIEDITLKLGGTSLTKAMITDVKVKCNGKTIIQATGTQLEKMSAFRGETSNAAYLNLPFVDRRGMTEADRMVGALDSGSLQSLTTEVTIAGATAPTLLGITNESAPQNDQVGGKLAIHDLLTKVLRYPYSVSAGGQLSVPLPFGPNNGARIKRIHVEHTGNMTGLTIKQNGNVIHESLTAEIQYEQTRWGLVPQANWYSVDFVMDGNFLKWLDTRDANTLEIYPTFSAADNGFVIVEYVDPLGNL